MKLYLKVIWYNKYLLAAYLLTISWIVMFSIGDVPKIITYICYYTSGILFGTTIFGKQTYRTYKTITKCLQSGKNPVFTPRAYCIRVGYDMAVKDYNNAKQSK